MAPYIPTRHKLAGLVLFFHVLRAVANPLDVVVVIGMSSCISEMTPDCARTV